MNMSFAGGEKVVSGATWSAFWELNFDLGQMDFLFWFFVASERDFETIVVHDVGDGRRLGWKGARKGKDRKRK